MLTQELTLEQKATAINTAMQLEAEEFNGYAMIGLKSMIEDGTLPKEPLMEFWKTCCLLTQKAFCEWNLQFGGIND